MKKLLRFLLKLLEDLGCFLLVVAATAVAVGIAVCIMWCIGKATTSFHPPSA